MSAEIPTLRCDSFAKSIKHFKLSARSANYIYFARKLERELLHAQNVAANAISDYEMINLKNMRLESAARLAREALNQSSEWKWLDLTEDAIEALDKVLPKQQ